MNTFIAAIALAITLLGNAAAGATEKPTVVLVHGAFADASSWSGVVKILERHGYSKALRGNIDATVDLA